MLVSFNTDIIKIASLFVGNFAKIQRMTHLTVVNMNWIHQKKKSYGMGKNPVYG